jgi:quinol monooxygenase YgiN
MAYVVTATWTVTEGNEEIVLDSLKKLTPASRAEPGCQYYQAYHDPADPRVFRLFEVYDDEAAYQAHGASDVTDDRLDLEMNVDVNGVRLGSDRRRTWPGRSLSSWRMPGGRRGCVPATSSRPVPAPRVHRPNTGGDPAGMSRRR